MMDDREFHALIDAKLRDVGLARGQKVKHLPSGRFGTVSGLSVLGEDIEVQMDNAHHGQLPSYIPAWDLAAGLTVLQGGAA